MPSSGYPRFLDVNKMLTKVKPDGQWDADDRGFLHFEHVGQTVTGGAVGQPGKSFDRVMRAAWKRLPKLGRVDTLSFIP